MRGYAPGVWKAVSLVLTATVLGLAGCAEVQEKPTTTRPVVKAGPDSVQLLRQASDAIEAGEFGNARRLLQQAGNQRLNRHDKLDWQILTTRLGLLTHDGTPESLEPLRLSLASLQRNQVGASVAQKRAIAQLIPAFLERQQQWWAAAEKRIALQSQLTGDDASSNHEQIWVNLLMLPDAELNQRLAQHQSPLPSVTQGWLSLAVLNTHQALSLDKQLTAVSRWQTRNPLHPAARVLPGSLKYLQSLKQARPDRVAVLLPLSGPLARSGKAIQDGLMASYYQAREEGSFAPQLQFIDSQAVDTLDSAYATALLAGAQWVIGPIGKTDVQALAKRPALSLPTLALNYDDHNASVNEYVASESLYQFGLAPEDEAEEVAERAWQDGRRHALVLVPKGNWGERVLAAFRARWLSLGGTINETHFYGNTNLNSDVQALLNVDSSAARNKRIRRFMSETTEFEPRRRQDADWVFLASTPQIGRQINPSMAFNFAKDLPIYATSRVFTGKPNPSTDKDLNGVRFCDLPWVLDQGPLHQTVEQNLPKGQGPYVRLYALGADAFWLPERLAQLQAFPQTALSGSTGVLRMDAVRRIHRRGNCAIFKNGNPVNLPTPDSSPSDTQRSPL